MLVNTKHQSEPPHASNVQLTQPHLSLQLLLVTRAAQISSALKTICVCCLQRNASALLATEALEQSAPLAHWCNSSHLHSLADLLFCFRARTNQQRTTPLAVRATFPCLCNVTKFVCFAVNCPQYSTTSGQASTTNSDCLCLHGFSGPGQRTIHCVLLLTLSFSASSRWTLYRCQRMVICASSFSALVLNSSFLASQFDQQWRLSKRDNLHQVSPFVHSLARLFLSNLSLCSTIGSFLCGSCPSGQAAVGSGCQRESFCFANFRISRLSLPSNVCSLSPCGTNSHLFCFLQRCKFCLILCEWWLAMAV